MPLGFTAIKKAVSNAASAAKDLAVQAKDEISLAPKSLKEYNVGRQIATGGPEGLWKIFSAESRTKGGATAPRLLRCPMKCVGPSELPLTSVQRSMVARCRRGPEGLSAMNS